MRITNNMITSRYTRGLNKSLSTLNTLAQKVETGRKFFKGSEDPIGAVKAYRLRREYLKNDDYLTNVNEADSVLTSAESSLMGVKKNLDGVYISYLKGINGTMDKESRDIISKELERIQESMITTLNSKFNDKYLFSGSSMEKPPFEMKNNELFYKGVNITNSTAADITKLEELSKENMFIDLGLSLNVDASGKINPNSVFDLSMPGINFMGFGDTTVDGVSVPNNLYDLMGEIRTQLERTDFSIDDISPYIKNFETQKNNVLMQVTNIGAKSNYIDFIKTRAEDTKINLTKKLKEVELVDPAEAITNWKMQEYAYTSALQMGTKLIQPSFMDFMR